MPVTVIKTLDQFKEIVDSGRLVAIYFGVAKATLCRLAGPMFEAYSELEELQAVEFYMAEVNEVEGLSVEAKIFRTPTFLIYNHKFRYPCMVDPLRFLARIKTYVVKIAPLAKAAAEVKAAAEA